MKTNISASLLVLLFLSLCSAFLCGCQSAQEIGKKDGDDMNPAINSSQRDLINQHKNRDVH